jgi:hypothetical protein
MHLVFFNEGEALIAPEGRARRPALRDRGNCEGSGTFPPKKEKSYIEIASLSLAMTD